MPELVVVENDEDVRKEISTLLSEATERLGYTYSPSLLTLAWVEDGSVIGGLAGSTNWDWLYIETLAIATGFRNQGLAKALVLKAEEIARERGCCGSWVDTFTFQVPEFYARLGYEPFGELPNYPAGQSRIFLRKLFTVNS